VTAKRREQEVYAVLGVHIHDDAYFEEILEDTWNLKDMAREDIVPLKNGRLEYLDVNANFR
jgi:hypothetical protein